MSTGNKGKFSERLKKIRLFKFRRNNKEEDDSYNNFYNVLKVAAVIPSFVYENFKSSDDLNKKKESIIADVSNKDIDDLSTIEDVNNIDGVSLNKNNIYKISNNNNINKHGESIIKNEKSSEIINGNILLSTTNVDNALNNVDDKKLEAIRKLEKKIIDTIKKDLIKMVNELEIDESELFLLDQVYNDKVTLNECREDLDKIKDLICKIDKIKEKYDFLRDTYDFEYILEYNNTTLIDDILDLKRMVSETELNELTNEYKLSKLFQAQYFIIDKIQNDAIKIEDNILGKEEDLKKRDIDFEKLQDDVFNVDDVNKKYSFFVNTQQEILDRIEENVNKIDSHEKVSYRLVGIDEIFANSFKYMGLLMMSPLRGLFPGIAVQTAITRNVIRNLHQTLHYEEDRSISYSAVDYSSTINYALDNLDIASNNIDLALDEIVKLKIDYSKKFKKYQSDFIKYKDTINKINDLENKLLGNKLKVEIMKKRFKVKEEENAKKLKLVRDLNHNSENK